MPRSDTFPGVLGDASQGACQKKAPEALGSSDPDDVGFLRIDALQARAPPASRSRCASKAGRLGKVNRKPEKSGDHRQHDAKGNPLQRAGAAHTPPQAMFVLGVSLVGVIVCHTVYPTAAPGATSAPLSTLINYSEKDASPCTFTTRHGHDGRGTRRGAHGRAPIRPRLGFRLQPHCGKPTMCWMLRWSTMSKLTARQH